MPSCNCRLCPPIENIKFVRQPRYIGDDLEVSSIPVGRSKEKELFECFNKTRFEDLSFENVIEVNDRPLKNQRNHLKNKKKTSSKFKEDSSIISRIVFNLIRFLTSVENPLSSKRDFEIKKFIDASFQQSWSDSQYLRRQEPEEEAEEAEEEFEFVEPMVFDLVRGLGAKVGESEVNYLMIIPLNGNTVRNLGHLNIKALKDNFIRIHVNDQTSHLILIEN